MVEQKLLNILDKASNREPITKDECRYILQLPPESYESGLVRSKANELIREKNNNAAIIIGQIGVDIHPCEAKCGFCSFGDGHTQIPTIKIDKDTLKAAIDGFCREGDLYGLYLMTMADTDKEYLIDMVRYARSVAPKETQIWVNTGDNEEKYYRELAAAGASGAYHVCRLGEGKDTQLFAEDRVKTMKSIKAAGLDLFSCVEPIGPEHTIDELIDKIYLCLDLGVTQFGAMRRIAVPGSPLEKYGQISNLQMAHVMGCVGLVYASVDSAAFFGVHEASEIGYLSGANFVTAETGANPRDKALDTSKNRGWDMNRCRKLMFECGFTHLLKGDGTQIDLNYEYLEKTDLLI